MTMSVLYKQGKSYEEIRMACHEPRPSLVSVKQRCRNQDWIVSDGRKGCYEFRNDHYDIVCKLYPGQIKPLSELNDKRKLKRKLKRSS